MDTHGIEIDLRTLRRYWEQDTGQVWFTFKCDYPGEPALTTQDVVEVARGVTDALTTPDASPPPSSESWMRTRTGWAAILWDVSTWDQAVVWFESFAASWDGCTGLLRGGPKRSVPRWTHQHEFRTSLDLAAYVAYTTEDLTVYRRPQRDRLWAVDSRFTHALTEQASSWTYRAGSAFHLVDRGGIEIVDGGSAVPLAELLLRNELVRLQSAHEPTRRFRSAYFNKHGRVSYKTMDPNSSWSDRLDDLLPMMVWASQRVDLAWVKYSSPSASWSGGFFPSLPYVEEMEFRYNRPLLAQFTPDVCGIQVLTDAHLSHANDLSDWLIEPLTGGRHLVQAKDLEAWYAHLEPDPDLLAKAREDFGDMILRPETIKTHSPWGAKG